ncbi:MAG: NAD(+) synthetase [Candidatus Magasanikbacteria bacterium CG_4_10_14_0_2_um_filter_37_12]|uniref:NH(3)-dependent NAD(+) synthetase n=1 Tax=Candidatus Magasanikbacteria bacterium CG_4_10_14_0_2_um_filter_37_12 TaxID=1974637 RepID=A0A2M7V8G7_9BACT|nr:MAG: NAD(+) synthetase [Candidatus Magasanikbacteria bacterium CG_4_10_14_0_2_um_filter_37_12]
MQLDPTKDKIIQFIRSHVGDKPVVIGLSGGIDSSLIAFLAVEALGADNVHAILSPASTNTAQDLELAQKIVSIFGLRSSVFNIEPILESFQKSTNLYKDQKSLGNLKARTRMSILYGKANEINGIVLGTGNKTELTLGYFTKYGDGGVDLLPIGDLYKTDERELAKYLGVPQEIIDRPPTAGLWEGQTDEDEMGITYDVLDKILMAIENKKSLDEFNDIDVEKVKTMMKNAEHKNKIPPICKI